MSFSIPLRKLHQTLANFREWHRREMFTQRGNSRRANECPSHALSSSNSLSNDSPVISSPSHADRYARFYILSECVKQTEYRRKCSLCSCAYLPNISSDRPDPRSYAISLSFLAERRRSREREHARPPARVHVNRQVGSGAFAQGRSVFPQLWFGGGCEAPAVPPVASNQCAMCLCPALDRW